MLFRVPTAITAILALSSCSFGYRLIAEKVGPSIQFRVAEGSGLLFQPVTCARSVSIRSDDPGEAQVWSWASPGLNDCLADFPLGYGANPPGATRVHAAKVLRPGTTYRIHVLSPGSGSGVGTFRITPSGVVENLPL
jgi:hypothetical protein